MSCGNIDGVEVNNRVINDSSDIYHECIVVWSSDSDSFETVIDEIQKFSDCIPLLSTSFLEHGDQFGRNVHGGAKFYHGTRSESVGMEVGQANGYYFDLEIRVIRHCA
jgi:hypothetical protein